MRFFIRMEHWRPWVPLAFASGVLVGDAVFAVRPTMGYFEQTSLWPREPFARSFAVYLGFATPLDLLARLVSPEPPVFAAIPSPRPPDLVAVVLDTVRTERTSAYGLDPLLREVLATGEEETKRRRVAHQNSPARDVRRDPLRRRVS